MTVHNLHAAKVMEAVSEGLRRYEQTDLDKLIWDAIVSGWTVELIRYTHTAIKESFDEWTSNHPDNQPMPSDIIGILEARSNPVTIH